MSLSFFNTLSRRLEPFEPIEPGRVRMYTCGPTVYNRAHIGNFRCYVFEDLLRRTIEWAGYDVKHVMNLTDVDDKTIRSANEQGLPLKVFTQKYVDHFFADLDVLRIRRAHVYPAATDNIPEMIALIETLIAKGYAYPSDDGSVYFSIEKFPSYGCLAHLDKSGLRAGARVAQDEYDKENLADFALWKAWDEKDGPVGWESPWGRGRPGWHIECSAMSMKYLGESFDLHAGGVDNIFPHHEDEIAQSEAATGRTFVKYWLHCAHLVVDGKKMSKSLGNFYTLQDLVDRGFNGREVRYQLIATHYRQSLNFTIDGLHAARAALGRLDEFGDRLRERAGTAAPGVAPAWASEGREAFRAALGQDLNISEGLAAVFEMLRAGNRSIDDGSLAPGAAAAGLAVWRDLDAVLGLFEKPEEMPDAETEALIGLRREARASKNWKESDRLRDEIAKRGWIVQDSPQGQKVRRNG